MTLDALNKTINAKTQATITEPEFCGLLRSLDNLSASPAYRMNTAALQPALQKVHVLGVRFITRGPDRSVKDIGSLNRLVKQIGGIPGYIPIPRNLAAAELCDQTPNAEAAAAIAMIEQALAEKNVPPEDEAASVAPPADDSWTYWGYVRDMVIHAATVTKNTAVSVATAVTPTWAKEMAQLSTEELNELLVALRFKADLHKKAVSEEKK